MSLGHESASSSSTSVVSLVGVIAVMLPLRSPSCPWVFSGGCCRGLWVDGVAGFCEEGVRGFSFLFLVGRCRCCSVSESSPLVSTNGGGGSESGADSCSWCGVDAGVAVGFDLEVLARVW